MRWLVLLMLAGCASPAMVAEPVSGVAGESLEDGTRYSFDQADLAEDGRLVRYRLTALADLTMNLSWSTTWPVTTTETECWAMAAVLESGQRYGLVAGAAWSIPKGVGAEARAWGQTISTGPLLDQEAIWGDGGFVGTASGPLRVGQSLLIEFGVSSADVFSEGAAAAGRLDVHGEHSLDRVPGSTLACGVGARGAQGSLGASVYIAEVESGGRIGFTSKQASTAWVMPGADMLWDVPELDFLGDVEEVRQPLLMTAPAAGDMALQFGDHVMAVGPPWLFVDSDWAID